MIYGNAYAPLVLIQMVDDHDLEGIESEVAEIKRILHTGFGLTCIEL